MGGEFAQHIMIERGTRQVSVGQGGDSGTAVEIQNPGDQKASVTVREPVACHSSGDPAPGHFAGRRDREFRRDRRLQQRWTYGFRRR